MRKGERTREAIVDKAAQLFSVKGFHGTSMEDLVNALGMTKGAVYNHFNSKEDICYAVLEKAGSMIQEKVSPFVRREENACDKLLGMLKGYRSYAQDRVFEGGCILLNLAVEMDDVHEGFKRELGEKLLGWRNWVIRIVERGKARGEVREEVDAEELASLIVSSLQGAMLQFKTLSDLRFFDEIYRFFERYINSQVRK